MPRGGGSIGARRGTIWAPAREGEAYIVPARGGGQGYALPWKKNSAICWVFLLLFCMWGPFCYVFLFVGAARALTPVQMFVGGGGGVGKPKKDHHKNIKRPPPPHNKKSSKKGPHMEKKSLKDPICMEIKIAKRPPQAAW